MGNSQQKSVISLCSKDICNSSFLLRDQTASEWFRPQLAVENIKYYTSLAHPQSWTHATTTKSVKPIFTKIYKIKYFCLCRLIHQLTKRGTSLQQNPTEPAWFRCYTDPSFSWYHPESGGFSNKSSTVKLKGCRPWIAGATQKRRPEVAAISSLLLPSRTAPRFSSISGKLNSLFSFCKWVPANQRQDLKKAKKGEGIELQRSSHVCETLDSILNYQQYEDLQALWKHTKLNRHWLAKLPNWNWSSNVS